MRSSLSSGASDDNAHSQQNSRDVTTPLLTVTGYSVSVQYGA
jgi:hypothetical protein